MTDASRRGNGGLSELELNSVQTHAVMVLDRQGKVVKWGAGAEQILGYSAEEMIGEAISKFFTPEDLAKVLAELELETAATSSEAEDDRWQVRKDGARIWVSGAVSPIRDSGGQCVGFVKILRNRTDNKIHVEALENRIAAIEGALERKNNFASALAHDLRNPLSSLSNAMHLLQSRDLSDDGRLAVDMMNRQIEFMSGMINGMLEATRSAAGKLTLRKQPVVLQEVLESAAEVCRPSLNGRRQQFELLIPPVPIVVEADGTRLRQVFVNLLENAAKYTPEEGNIWLKATQDGEDCTVKVQDTGIGISPDMLPHIFDLFAQVETADRSQGGLGIGLSVVKDIVTLHGGTVQVLSDGLGKGSEFIVRLPARGGSSTPRPPD